MSIPFNPDPADTFMSWAGNDNTAAAGNLTFEAVPAKPWDDDDVEIKVLYCGMCASDVTMLAGSIEPVLKQHVCGHEIIGEVVRVGPAATGVSVGQIVGVGAQCDSCRSCESCVDREEQFCPQPTYTCGVSLGPYHRGAAAGQLARGGFAKRWRGPARFVVPLPKGVDARTAGPLFCGGITVYSPMVRYGVGTRAKRVGIVGIGGLGHLGIMIAKAMGASVTAISRGTAKREDALKLGADKYIATGADQAADFKEHARSLDLIICTINPPELDLQPYLSLLRPTGLIVTLGVVAKPFVVSSVPIVMGSVGVVGSQIGSPAEIHDLLALAAQHDIKPWVQFYNFDDINTALVDFNAGKPNFRFVLVNTDNGAEL